jgi:hypothetical protein
MRLAWIALTMLLSGCQALKTPESQAWLALHAVDTVQTFRIADDPRCFKESDSLTRRLIGEHPSDGEVAAWAIGSAALHLGVTELLLRNEHPRLAKAWQWVRIGVTAAAVADNYTIGVRIGSPNDPKYPCMESQPSRIPEPPPRRIG